MNKHVIMTGGGGYVGSVAAGYLLDAGYNLTIIDRFFFGESCLKSLRGHPRLKLQEADIRDLTPQDFEDAWAVVDLAALSNDPTGDLDHDLTREINEHGRINLARSAKLAGVERYVFLSSCSVYGSGSEENLKEDSPLRPLTAYARACAAAEEKIRALNDNGFTAVALRLGTVFGLSSRMRFDLVVNVMTAAAFDHAVISVTGGCQWRPLVHVKDAARAILAGLHAPDEIAGGRAFNIGRENLRVGDIAAIVRDSVPANCIIETSNAGVDRRDYHVSFDRAAKDLGFTAMHSVTEGALEIYEALKLGFAVNDERAKTVMWYKRLLRRQPGLRPPLRAISTLREAGFIGASCLAALCVLDVAV